MTNTYGPEIGMLKIVDSIFYHTPNGVWAPGIAFPTGTTLPTIDQTPENDDPHEGDFFLLLTNPPHLYQLKKPQGQNDLQWIDLGTNPNAISWCGTTVPGSGEGADLDLFNKYESGNPKAGAIYQKIDAAWRNIGSNQTGLPLSTAAINFTDSSKTFRQANLGLLIVSDDGSSPLLATDVGFVVKKDITAGGYVGANQGELWLGHGRHNATDNPKIVLMHSTGSYFANHCDPAGQAYDTLYITRADCSTAANLDLDNLTVHGSLLGNVTADTNLILSASNGAVQLQTGGSIQWGTHQPQISRSVATRAFNGTPAVEIWGWNSQHNPPQYEAGVLITSALQVDHIDSCNGEGITVFDKLNGNLNAQNVYARGTEDALYGAHLSCHGDNDFHLATYAYNGLPYWKIGFGDGSGGFNFDMGYLASETYNDGTVKTTINVYNADFKVHSTHKIKANDYYDVDGTEGATFHGKVTGSATAIPTYNMYTEPSSPPTGSIWLRV